MLMTLCTPATAAVFAAGTSSYGVSDLTLLAEDTHKFESQYLFKLVGGTPTEVPEIYAARSAVKHADQIRSPLLVSSTSCLKDLQLTTLGNFTDPPRFRR